MWNHQQKDSSSKRFLYYRGQLSYTLLGAFFSPLSSLMAGTAPPLRFWLTTSEAKSPVSPLLHSILLCLQSSTAENRCLLKYRALGTRLSLPLSYACLDKLSKKTSRHKVKHLFLPFIDIFITLSSLGWHLSGSNLIFISNYWCSGGICIVIPHQG